MTRQTCRYIAFVLIFAAGYLFVFPDCSLSSENNNIAVVISKKIRPYLNVLDGIVDGVAEDSNKIEVFFLSNSDKNNKKIQNKLLNGQYDLCVAVGPDAAEFVWALNEKFEHSKIYTAVLNPDNIIKNSLGACGISLRIPVETQVQEIARSFPDIKRIGLMFDADHNEWFYEKASNAAKIYGMEIIPLYVDSKIQIPKKIKDNWKRVDCIWMIPDKTVISEKIIQYVIKQGIYND
jgi:putative ABC transport system substrate-binding protein